MRKYEEPKLEVQTFQMEDIMNTSVTLPDEPITD